MKAILLALAIALAETTVPPFPPPKVIQVTPETKCDWGPVSEAKSGQVVFKADAGDVTLEVDRKTKIIGADGKPLDSAKDLKAGTKIRAYYVIDGGAQAREIDVIP